MQEFEETFKIPEPAPLVLETLLALGLPYASLQQLTLADGVTYQVELKAGGELEIQDSGDAAILIVRTGDTLRDGIPGEHDRVLRTVERAWPMALEAEGIRKSERASDHYAYPDPEKRRAIVVDYRRAKAAGEVKNKNDWAEWNYQITGKTLRNYEKEFPEET